MISNIALLPMYGVYIDKPLRTGDECIHVTVKKIKHFMMKPHEPEIDEVGISYTVPLTEPYQNAKYVIPNYLSMKDRALLEAAGKFGIHVFKDKMNEAIKKIIINHITWFLRKEHIYNFTLLYYIICDSCESLLPHGTKVLRFYDAHCHSEDDNKCIIIYEESSHIDLCEECYTKKTTEELKEIEKLLGQGTYIKLRDKSIDYIKLIAGQENDYNNRETDNDDTNEKNQMTNIINNTDEIDEDINKVTI